MLTRMLMALLMVGFMAVSAGTLAGCGDGEPSGPDGCVDDADCPEGQICLATGECLAEGTAPDGCEVLADCCADLDAADQADCLDVVDAGLEPDCVDALLSYEDANAC